MRLLVRASTVLGPFASLLIALVLCAASAQEGDVFFDKYKHLEKIQECELSDYSDVYDFTPYDPHHHEWISFEELAELRASWAKERVRARARIEEIEGDPRERFLYVVQRRLRSHTFFSKIKYERVDTYAPFVLYVQEPQRARANHTEVVSRFYGPWLQALEKLFREEYAEPLGLEHNDALPVYPVVVLNSHGDYINYADAASSNDLYAARAHYDPRIKMAVTYDDSFAANKEPAHVARRAALHELIHLLQHAYNARADERVLARMPTWFNEGLAEYLSYHLGPGTDDLARHRVDKPALDLLAQARTYKLREAPVARLIAFRNYGEVQLAGIELSVFYAQASLFMHFLHTGEGGKHRAASLEYVRLILSGKTRSKAFREAFAGVDLADLDEAFQRYLGKQSPPLTRLKATHISAAMPVAAAASPKANPNAPKSHAGFEPSALLTAVDGAEVRMAMALCRARRGEVDAALADLNGIAELDTVPGDIAERLELEETRLEAWIQLRNDHLERLVASGKSQRINIDDGRKIQGTIERIDGDALVLSRKGKTTRVTLASIAPVHIARHMGADHGLAEDWTRLYAYVIADHKNWKSLLAKRKGSDARALERDGSEYYPAALRLGEAATTLERLASSELPSDAASARACLTGIEELLALRELSVVTAATPALEQLAGLCLERVFVEQGLGDFLGADPERLDEDRIRLTYAFARPTDLADFDVDPEFLGDEHSALPKTTGEPHFHVRDGRLHGSGNTALIHKLEFAAPITVRYQFKLEKPVGRPSADWFSFSAGICSDRYGNRVASQDLGDLYVLDKQSAHQQSAPARNRNGFIGQEYRLAIHHDGTKVTSHCDGQEQAYVNAGARTEGKIYFWIHSDLDIVIRNLEIEGRVTQASMDRARAAWVKEQLAGMGFE